MEDRGALRRLEALVQVGMTLASELSLPAVLQKIIDLSCEVADARYGALGVVGPDGKIAEFITHGVTEEERRRIGSLPEGHGILGVLINEAKPLRLRRIQDHPKSYGFPEHHPPMTSFLGVPVSVRGRVFGNLYLTEKIGEGEFTEEDERAVITLAAQAGVAIENARLYSETDRNRRRLAAVNRITTSILEGAQTADVLRTIARSARDLAGAALATVAVPDANGEHLVIEIAEGAEADRLRGMRFPVEGSISGEVMRSGEPAVLRDASAHPNVHQPVVRIGGIGPALLVPLGIPGRMFGTLAAANVAGGRMFDDDDLSAVQAFASQAAVALEYARVRDELERMAVVEDRERIAKELHDGVVQSLFAVGMSLQAAEAMADDPGEVRKRLNAAVDDIDRSIRDLRNYIFGLRPGEMADWQLVRALRELVAGFAVADTDVEVDLDPGAAARVAGKAFDVVQVAREALSNAVRHAAARTARLRLTAEGEKTVIEVSDDGVGFDPDTASGGHGLGNMRARADALGGSLTITSRPGQGTTVRIEITR